MPQTLKIGIIGCGGIANGKHLPALASLEDVEMAAFCDIVPNRAAEARAKYGSTEAKVYDTYQELLADDSLDIVHVLTPNNSHAEIAVAALEAGKHVNCEKPMAKTAAEARLMLQAAKRTGKKLTISYQNRFREDSQYLYHAIRQGDLGDIYYAKAHAVRRRAVPTWGVFLDAEKQGGGPLIDIGTHALDLTLWMMDNYQPKTVLGQTFRKLGDREEAANAWGPWDPKQFTTEDAAVGMITMQNGASITIEASWALNIMDTEEATCTLCGTEGGADFHGGLRLNGERYSRLYNNQVVLGGSGVAFFDAPSSPNSAAEAEMRAWVNAVRTDTDVVVKPEQALVVSELLEAIYASAKTGQAVSF